MNLLKKIREIPHWPTKGVNFKDITPLLSDARGFLLSAALAYKLKTGLTIVRKKGKLPYKTIRKRYTLEYATNIIEMHQDAIRKGERVLVVDDVLATGGTLKAACDLVTRLGGNIVGIAVLIELDFLKGRKKLEGYSLHSVLHYLS